MSKHNRGFTLIELLIVVVIIGILVAIVVPKFANGKERAMVSAMRSDLHNLVTAQEAFFTNGLTYYNGPVPDPSFSYNVSDHVTVTLVNVTASGWGATATHAGSTRTCAVFVGTGGPVAPAVDGRDSDVHAVGRPRRGKARVVQRRSLRTELLVSLGFVTSSAVILVGLTTVLLNGGDVRQTLWPLVSLWVGSTAVFVLFGAYLVHRLVVRPLGVLAAEADRLAVGALPSPPPVYETAELDQLTARYRAMAEDLLDAQSHIVRVEKLAGIGQLAAGVAHEVRNPLGAIATYSRCCSGAGADPAVTGEMRRAIERIERIVQGLLDYGGEPGAAVPVPGARHRSQRRGPDGGGLPRGAGHVPRARGGGAARSGGAVRCGAIGMCSNRWS